MVYIGSFIGFYVFTYIADNFGRKIGLSYSWIIGCIGMLIISFLSNNYYVSGVGFFLMGFGMNPAITLHYSFFSEHSSIFLIFIKYI